MIDFTAVDQGKEPDDDIVARVVRCSYAKVIVDLIETKISKPLAAECTGRWKEWMRLVANLE